MMGKTAMGGSALPKSRPGDYERALELIAALGGSKDVKVALAALRDAEKSHDLTRERAEAAAGEADKRKAAAERAEAKATAANQRLADQTAKDNAELTSRERGVGGRETAATEREATLDARDIEFSRREKLLRDAGVTGFAD